MDPHHSAIPGAGPLLAVVALLGAGGAAAAGADPVCVENRDDAARVFTVEVGSTRRGPARLAPGERLCAPRAAPGAHAVVSAYPDREALEGCSRLVTGTGGDTLLRYAEFDRCLWASHRQGGGD